MLSGLTEMIPLGEKKNHHVSMTMIHQWSHGPERMVYIGTDLYPSGKY